MPSLLLSILTLVIGLAAHALAMRHFQRQWILMSVPIFLLGAMGLIVAGGLALNVLIPVEEFIVALVLVLSLGFGYTLTLVGVIHDSPTLSIVNEIKRYGAIGMPVSAVENFIETHPFFESRFSALLSSGEVHLQDDTIVLTGRVSRLLSIGDYYRHARGGNFSRTG